MSKNYTDKQFETVTDEIEELLGDLLGIEAASKAVIEFIKQNQVAADPDFTTTFQLALPAKQPFEVYPMLPIVDSASYHQDWISSHFEAGKAWTYGLAAWWRSLVDNYYLVDTDAIISAATTQADMVLSQVTRLDEDLGEVSGNLAVHWDGAAKEEFFEWFPRAGQVVSALLLYAHAAQTSAGAAADVIAATQVIMLRQAEECRDTLTKAIESWRKDADVFPFPPGSGYKFAELGRALSAEIDEYIERIPGDGPIVRTAENVLKKGIKEGIAKNPGVKKGLMVYTLLTKLEQHDTDEVRPPDGAAVAEAFEMALRKFSKEGDKALDKIGARIAPLARDLASDNVLCLDRLPRSPVGNYTA